MENSLIRTVLKWIGKCSGKLADLPELFQKYSRKIKVLLVGGAFYSCSS